MQSIDVKLLTLWSPVHLLQRWWCQFNVSINIIYKLINIVISGIFLKLLILSYFLVAPDTVTIKGPEMARINETVTLECETSNSNPASSIQWVIGGRILPAIYTRNDTSDEGGWVTKSNISFTVSDSYRTKNVSCYANNFALSTTKVQSHKITVLCKYSILIQFRNTVSLQLSKISKVFQTFFTIIIRGRLTFLLLSKT
jgi:hypothetical protein